MTERDRTSPSDHDETGDSARTDEVIPGQHGKHGGSLESEGAPQEHAREAERPKHNGIDRNRH